MISIDDREIGEKSPPFVIAELSGNHKGSLQRALELVDAAADAGADAVKLQTYTADTMTIDADGDEFRVTDAESPWAGSRLYDLYAEAATPWEWHAEIFEYARHRELIAFSTPFDAAAVDLLQDLDVPCFKIASFEITHLPLIRRVARLGKPLFMSTGMARLGEIDAAVQAALSEGCHEIILMKCTSSYPAPASEANLKSLPTMSEAFGCPVGLSDHTLGIGVSLAAVALGAVAIEKHLTIDQADGGIDSSFSMTPDELSRLVVESRRAWEALGSVHFATTEADHASLKYRRSLYINKDLPAGHVLAEEDIKVVRPGYGLDPDMHDLVIGRALSKPVARGTALTWELL